MNFLRWLFRWGCLVVVLPETPSARISLVMAESRTMMVPAESRTMMVPAERRVTIVPPEIGG